MVQSCCAWGRPERGGDSGLGAGAHSSTGPCPVSSGTTLCWHRWGKQIRGVPCVWGRSWHRCWSEGNVGPALLSALAHCGNLQPPFPSSPLRLCAQVYRAKMEGDSGALPPRMKSSTPSSSQLNIAMLGRSPSPKVWLQREPCPVGGCCLVPALSRGRGAMLTVCCPAPGPPARPEPRRQLATQPGGHAAGHRDQAPAGPAAEG